MVKVKSILITKSLDRKKLTGFTLIELGIVLILIGLIISGITKGGQVVTASRLASARSLTARSSVNNIAGLIAWYEASSKASFKTSETTNLSNISQWNDISANSVINSRNLLTKTANTNITYRLDGINRIPALYFQNNERITLANFYQGRIGRATIFVVFRPNFNVTTSPSILVDSAPSQGSFYTAIKSNQINLNAGVDGNSSTSVNAPSIVNSRDYILCAYLNSTSSQAYVNNAITSSGSAVFNSGTNNLAGLTIGASNVATSGFTGLISEVIIFNRPLKLQERKDVMLYLSIKYRINIVS